MKVFSNVRVKHFKSIVRRNTMGFFKKQCNVYLFKIIIVFAFLATVVFLVIYLSSKPDSKWTPLLGGMTTGLLIALLQLLLMWTEHSEIEKIKKLGIKKILPYRDDKDFYETIINNAREEIRVLGSTAFRFLKDFADENREDKKALLDALNREVCVKFLLPKPECLWNDEDISKGKSSLVLIQKLKEKYGDLVECRYYSHNPFHNLLLSDNDCFVGPIFPNRTSQNTPTIFTDIDSVFAKSYLEYFEYEWKDAQPCP